MGHGRHITFQCASPDLDADDSTTTTTTAPAWRYLAIRVVAQPFRTSSERYRDSERVAALNRNLPTDLVSQYLQPAGKMGQSGKSLLLSPSTTTNTRRCTTANTSHTRTSCSSTNVTVDVCTTRLTASPHLRHRIQAHIQLLVHTTSAAGSQLSAPSPCNDGTRHSVHALCNLFRGR